RRGTDHARVCHHSGRGVPRECVAVRTRVGSRVRGHLAGLAPHRPRCAALTLQPDIADGLCGHGGGIYAADERTLPTAPRSRSPGAGMSEAVIVDYAMATRGSVQKAFEGVGHAATIPSDPTRVAAAGKVVLPGVGAFRDAIARLREAPLAEPILDHLRADK